MQRQSPQDEPGKRGFVGVLGQHGESAEGRATVLRPRTLPAAPPDVWHWPEYGAELAGTAWNVFIGLSAVVFNMAPGMPGGRLIPDFGLRLWVTGLIFAGSGSLYTISPWGRLSGSHINPSVTLAFWVRGKVRGHDLLGYLVAQFIGGVLGALLLADVWRGHAVDVGNGRTLPGVGLDDDGRIPRGVCDDFFLRVGNPLFRESAAIAALDAVDELDRGRGGWCGWQRPCRGRV